MKKLFSIFVLLMSLLTAQCVFVSCDKDDDNDDFYAGESELDYKPAYYSISSEWDLSKVQGLTEVEKKTAAADLADAVKGTALYNTRTEAVKAFDSLVEQMRTSPEMKIKGMKAKIYLKRENAIIKSASLSW